LAHLLKRTLPGAAVPIVSSGLLQSAFGRV